MNHTLERIKHEGYLLGKIEAEQKTAQMRVSAYDEGYAHGYREAGSKEPSRVNWFFLGVGVCAFIYLAVYFWMHYL